MTKEIVSSFLTNMFEDNKLFAEINGTKNLMDAKYMLVADALSENVELLTEVISEQIKLNKVDSINNKNIQVSAAL